MFRTGYIGMSLIDIREVRYPFQYGPQILKEYAITYPYGGVLLGAEVRLTIAGLRLGVGTMRRWLEGHAWLEDPSYGTLFHSLSVDVRDWYLLFGFDLIRVGPVGLYLQINPIIQYGHRSEYIQRVTPLSRGSITDVWTPQVEVLSLDFEPKIGGEITVWGLLVTALEAGYHVGFPNVFKVYRRSFGLGGPRTDTDGIVVNLLVGVEIL